MRVPGLPIRDCARGWNNRGHTRPQISAINVTEKILFERLYLVPGMGTFGPWVNCPYAPTTPTVYSTTISRFSCNYFPRMVPHFFGHHDSPSKLAESRYPHPHIHLHPRAKITYYTYVYIYTKHCDILQYTVYIFVYIYALAYIYTPWSRGTWKCCPFINTCKYIYICICIHATNSQPRLCIHTCVYIWQNLSPWENVSFILSFSLQQTLSIIDILPEKIHLSERISLTEKISLSERISLSFYPSLMERITLSSRFSLEESLSLRNCWDSGDFSCMGTSLQAVEKWGFYGLGSGLV